MANTRTTAGHPRLSIPELREFFNRWDPIGILESVPDPPHDEYDRLLAPVAALLGQPQAREHLTKFRCDEMSDNFGLDPELVGVKAFVEVLVDGQQHHP